MAAMPALSALTLSPHSKLTEDAPNDVYCLNRVGAQQIGIYMPQTEQPRSITPSRGNLAEDVERDGMCLFHCISKLHNRTFGEYKTTPRVINDIRSHLERHWDRIAAEHEVKSDKAAYLASVGVRWGGPLEIDAACEAYQVNIFEWTSIDALNLNQASLLTDEQALQSAVLSARYHAKKGTSDELKALPTWDLFWNRSHFRYLEKKKKKTSRRIHDAPAPTDPDEEATMRLVRELAAQEDAKLARKLEDAALARALAEEY